MSDEKKFDGEEVVTKEEGLTCLFILLIPVVFMGFMYWIVLPVFDGEAPTWKIVAFIAAAVLYGLLGGLGKAFEAGLSGMNLLKTFGWVKKDSDPEVNEKDDKHNQSIKADEK